MTLEDWYLIRIVLRSGAEHQLCVETQDEAAKAAEKLSMLSEYPSKVTRWTKIEGKITTPLIISVEIMIDAAEVASVEIRQNSVLRYEVKDGNR